MNDNLREFFASQTHHCHANGCNEVVDPKFLMCRKHWFMVPQKNKLAVYRHYRKGQEIDKNPTAAYLEAAQAAIDAVARKEERKAA
jgi:hypothetical protein